MAQTDDSFVEFFNLNPRKNCGSVVRHPGNEPGVTVLTGRSGVAATGATGFTVVLDPLKANGKVVL
jgi:hypothetical protein